QGPEIALPALCHPQQGRLPARGMLPGDKAQPGGELASIVARRRIANGRDERRGGQEANPGQLRQPLTRLISREHPLDLLVGGCDPLIQSPQLLGERVVPLPCCRRQAILRSFEDKGQWLLLDARVVDSPRSSNLIVVTLSSVKPLFFNGLKKVSHCSDNVGASDPGIQ